jgi:flagellar motility protein MotE (MotC chaperone)
VIITSLFLKFRPFIPQTEKAKQAYEELKKTIRRHLAQRKGFLKRIDVIFVDRLARLICDWLYVETKLTSTENVKEAAKWAYILGVLDVQLNQAFDVLELKPRQRREILAGMQNNTEAEFNERLKSIIGVV